MFHYDGTIRDCLPPRRASPPRRLQVPPGAWETHAHVIGVPPDHPLVPDRHFTAPAAPPADFIAMLDRVGLAYGVLVQVSAHGTDNRLLLEALRRYPDRLRGVAVVDAATPDAVIAELKDAGVTGIRILDIVGGGVGMRSLEALADRCAELGWHIQVAVKGPSYSELEPRLARLRVPFIIDHMGWCPAPAGIAQPDFQAVLRLVRDTGCYVKLSGGFRLSGEPKPFRDTYAFARALIAAAPDRMVWGSDWPHVGLYDAEERPDVGELLDGLADYTSDPGMQRRILVDNPARFYGLPHG
ncbi:amidohydrolase family protein [Chelatococcus reniformis]|uniref:Hydrolase n=1 Tax=Chelatococcus reniformis TaxID=1494448 RepID=A0A916UX61_9HYPH|nr:amidohydrolase family protein [Chelatococcus reniformis]GGC91113.1 hydrolase [Chelatococcus reniformis]